MLMTVEPNQKAKSVSKRELKDRIINTDDEQFDKEFTFKSQNDEHDA